MGGVVEYLAYGSERARSGLLLAERDHAWAGHGGFDGNGVADFGSRSYLEDLPRFVTPDRVDYGSAADPQSLNRYAYGRGNPYRYVDPSGNVIETAWDIANLGMGVVSLVANAAAGNWGGAALDAVGLVADAAATVVPGMPGGAGAAIKAYRAADKVADVVDAARQVDRVADGAKGAKAATGGAKVLGDGAGASAADVAASVGGPTGGVRGSAQRAKRAELIDANTAPDGSFSGTCWRCGTKTSNPANMHLGHKNVPTSKGGNLEDVNVCLEGAACNLSAGNRGAPSPGMSCAERGGCGAPYGRTD